MTAKLVRKKWSASFHCSSSPPLTCVKESTLHIPKFSVTWDYRSLLCIFFFFFACCTTCYKVSHSLRIGTFADVENQICTLLKSSFNSLFCCQLIFNSVAKNIFQVCSSCFVNLMQSNNWQLLGQLLPFSNNNDLFTKEDVQADLLLSLSHRRLFKQNLLTLPIHGVLSALLRVGRGFPLVLCFLRALLIGDPPFSALAPLSRTPNPKVSQSKWSMRGSLAQDPPPNWCLCLTSLC